MGEYTARQKGDGEWYGLVERKARKGEKVYVSTAHDSGFFTCMGDSAYTEGSIKISEIVCGKVTRLPIKFLSQ